MVEIDGREERTSSTGSSLLALSYLSMVYGMVEKR
jgi:hypothetical protein